MILKQIARTEQQLTVKGPLKLRTFLEKTASDLQRLWEVKWQKIEVHGEFPQ